MTTQNHPLPKYMRISQEIIGRIRNGELGRGAQVPSENEIISSYGVSNTTARRALQEIERQGWATRIKGRGTYVRQSRIDRTAGRILGFTKNMLESGRRPATKLLSAEVSEKDYGLTIHGKRYTLPAPHYRIRRLRLADDVPMMIETRCISQRLCGGILERDLEQSLYEIYERDYGIELTEVLQLLSAVTLDGPDVETFELEKPIPAFRVEGVTFCRPAEILEMEESIYRGDSYRFLVKATR